MVYSLHDKTKGIPKATYRFVSLFLPNMNSSLIYVHTAYNIEKIIRYSNPPIFDNLRASRLSRDLVFVWVHHLHALNAQDIPQNTVRD